MKAISELGTKRIILYVLFNFVVTYYHLIIDHFFNLPPIRKLTLQMLGVKIGKNSVIMAVKFVNAHYKGFIGLKIGQDCFIGDEALFDLYNVITLQDQVTIAQRVTMLTHVNVGFSDHPLQRYFPKYSAPVTVERGAVVGAGSTILPGVTIGENSFVAAGSVVTKSVQKNVLVAGVPAKIIRILK